MASAAVFEGDVFTFEIGPDKKRFIVHKKLLEDHSPVLRALMNNGMMKESTTGLAFLEEVEPQIFGLFAEYIYTGMYRAAHLEPESAVTNPEHCHTFSVICFRSGTHNCTVKATYSSKPTVCPTCKTENIDVKDVNWCSTTCNQNVQYVPESFEVPTTESPLSDKLVCFKFPALGRNHQSLRKYLKTIHPPDPATNKLLSHAMLAVFAQEYLVEGLFDLCLHKLHRDMLAFTVNAKTVAEVTHLLTWTYDNTQSCNGGEIKKETTSTGLRELVVEFAVCNAKILLQCEEFRIMLQGGGELVSDFADGIMA